MGCIASANQGTFCPVTAVMTYWPGGSPSNRKAPLESTVSERAYLKGAMLDFSLLGRDAICN